MEPRLPYYMAYPMPLIFDDDRISRRDYDYMKSMYPDMAKKLVPYIEEECDKLEYTGSLLYDEYPDYVQLRLLCKRVYEKVQKEPQSSSGLELTGAIKQTEMMNQIENRKEGGTDSIMDLIQVMVYQELCQRRREHRTRRQKYY